ncbi:MAG: damage-inducible protein CinA [Candidatus Heimdallarchaeota archaeon]|nr:damage-inducible protein CinA [Candidatus Heimdallarchaeota archaeon]
MVSALLISIGNELLSGKTINTNATFLAKKLTQIGFIVKKIVTIPDKEDIVVAEIRNALENENYGILILTGGLGPTWDDSTAKFLGTALKVEVQINNKALEIVTRRYQELYREKLVDTADITPAREKMAYIPLGGKPIDNKIGTAPGIYYYHQISNTKIFCLPGVPREMESMFFSIEDNLLTLVRTEKTGYFEMEYLTHFKDESLLAPYIDEVLQKFNVWIKSLPETYQEYKSIKVIISKTANSNKEAKKEVLAAKQLLEELLLHSKGN